MEPKKRFLLKALLLLVFPVLILDTAFRFQPDSFTWYSQVQAKLRSDEVNVFLVGTSRVAVGIDADRATALLREGAIPNARVYNLGAPYSTIAEHFLGLRNMAAEKPEALKGSIWLIEGHYGLPGERATWDDPWLNPDYREFLLNVLKASDLPRFWSMRGLDFFDKAYISTTFFSKLGRAFLDTRLRLITVGERAVDRWLRKLRENSTSDALASKATRETEMAPAAGVRTDEAGIQYARQLALRIAERDRGVGQEPYADWDGQILREWVDQVKRAGGRAFLFDMPLSSVQAAVYLTPTRREDSRKFEAVAAGWAMPILSVPFRSADEDFPDLIHLRKLRRAEYTDALVGELTATLRR